MTGGDFFDGGSRNEYAVGIKTSAPQEVYLLTYRAGETYYLPALRFEVNVNDYPVEENISALYVQLVDF